MRDILFMRLSLDGHWGVFQFIGIMNSTTMNVNVHISIKHLLSVSSLYT
jgi:hypothetical protein